MSALIVQNYINGNLTDAKRQARDRSYGSIRLAFEQYGFSLLTASALEGALCREHLESEVAK